MTIRFETEAEVRHARLADLSIHKHPLYRVQKRRGSDGAIIPRSELRQPVDISEAQLIGSNIEGSDKHTVMLDLDVPAKLVPSSTPGHSHLYIDVPMSWRRYKRLLKALTKAGVIEPGYYGASVARKHTSLRLPWVVKHDDDSLKGSA